LDEISNMLGTVIKRLEKTESKLESMERQLEKSSFSSGSSSELFPKRCLKMPTSVLIPPSPQKNFPGYVFVS
jgi:hypothetical protein